jgi:flagellum-specific peptidoglycan hydrolase FlgJ
VLIEETDSTEQTADSRQQTADSIEQTADSRQQTADSRQQTADSRQQTADSLAYHGVLAEGPAPDSEGDQLATDGGRGQGDQPPEEGGQVLPPLPLPPLSPITPGQLTGGEVEEREHLRRQPLLRGWGWERGFRAVLRQRDRQRGCERERVGGSKGERGHAPVARATTRKADRQTADRQTADRQTANRQTANRQTADSRQQTGKNVWQRWVVLRGRRSGRVSEGCESSVAGVLERVLPVGGVARATIRKADSRQQTGRQADSR